MATYPTPGHSATYDTGPIYLKYLRLRTDFSEITVQSVFEDQGRDFNSTADTAPIRWLLEYDGLTDDDANILDQFYDDHGISTTFTFIEPRNHPWTGGEGNTYSGVRFESYEKDHFKVQDTQKRTVRLVKYPS